MEIELVTLTDSQKKARRNRSVAIAVCLFALVAIFYVATFARLGSAVAERTF
jgi:hypothetical protein